MGMGKLSGGFSGIGVGFALGFWDGMGIIIGVGMYGI